MTLPIDHVAIVVHNLDRALAFYGDTLGLDVTERRKVPEEGVEMACLALAQGRIELIQPLSGEGGVARFLEKRGEGLHHVCLVADDIVKVMENLQEAGAELITDEPQTGADGRRYVFVHPRSAHGVLLELYEESA